MKYKGRELLPLHRIVIRVLCFGMAKAFMLPACLFIWAGWGIDEALDVWEKFD